MRAFSAALTRGGEAGCCVAQHLAMTNAECLDPALLPERESDEKSELYQLGNREVLMEFRPERIVCDIGIPGDRARIGERDFLTLGEFIGIGKIEQLVVFVF